MEKIMEPIEPKSDIVNVRRCKAYCGKIGIVLFNPTYAHPIIITIDSPGVTSMYHLSVSDAEQLRDNLINIILESNDIEVPEPDGV